MKSKLLRNFMVLLMMVGIAALSFAKGSKDSSSTADNLGQTPQTLPDWSEERPIPDFGFSEGEMPPTPPEGFPEDFDPTQMGEVPENFDPTKMGKFPGNISGEAPVNEAASNQSSRNILTNQDDFIENNSFSSSVEINLTKATIKYGGNATEENVDIQVDENGYSLSSTLNEALNIKLTGKLNGTFSVDSTENVIALSLNNVEITAKDGPAINLLTKKKTFVSATKNSENFLTDSENRDANTKKGAIYAKGALIFDSMDSKAGTITVNAGYKHGVYSDDYIKINDGTLNVNISARDAIRSINGFIMNDGNITIRGTGTVVDEESKGIKVDGEESTKYAGEGFIVINNGKIDIETVGKAITASWEAEDDAETSENTDDPNPYVTINNGTIMITTTAKPYETTLEDGTEVSCSPEGIEAKSDLTINGGNIKISTADDALNAGISITINGGDISIVTTENDAIDSNGTLTINGGTIYAIGGSGAETAFDSDMYPFTVNGGTIFGLGGSNISSPNQNSKANVVVWYGSFSKDSTVTVKNSSGKKIISYKSTGNGESVILSSENLIMGETYTVSNGTTEETFTIDSNITTIGSKRGFGGPGGFGGNMENQRGNFGRENFGEKRGNMQNTQNQKDFSQRKQNQNPITSESNSTTKEI